MAKRKNKKIEQEKSKEIPLEGENLNTLNNQNEVKRIAVLLVNFGGPDRYESVKPFLYNLFSDPVILNFKGGSLFRKPLAWLISNMKDFNSRMMYKCVKGTSPLLPITFLQAEKLQNLLLKNGFPIDVFVSFRYCKPDIEKTLSEIKEKGFKKIIILPLFPQYSFTTTGSVQLLVEKWIEKNNLNTEIEIKFVKDWYRDKDYIEAYCSMINQQFKHLDLRSTELIFSAHGIPIINIENGDPYESQIKESAELIVDKLNWKKKWHLSYQSKVGPVKWLEPATNVLIEELSKKSNNVNILIVPISFTCEHVETIYEIGKLYKDIAIKSGIKSFRRVPALNTNKYLIQALYNQVIDCLGGNQINMKELLLAN